MCARRVLAIALLAPCLISTCSSPATEGTRARAASDRADVVKLGVQLLDTAPGPGRVNRPYFDASGRLRFDDSLADGPSPCLREARPTERMTLMVSPRVDRVRCPPDGAEKRPSTVLQGLQKGGKPAWQRPLGFSSGTFTIAEEVLGASWEGILLSNLSVIAAETGEVVVKPPTHTVGPERRPVPDHDLTGAALYLPERRGFLWFFAEVTLLERKGGLFFIDAGSGRKELWRPVSATLGGGYWRVEEMALAEDQDRHHALLAHKFAIRGPGAVSVAVFDPEGRDIAFEERLGEGHFCEQPQVVTGPDGRFGLAYFDATESKRVLVDYRLHAKN